MPKCNRCVYFNECEAWIKYWKQIAEGKIDCADFNEGDTGYGRENHAHPREIYPISKHKEENLTG